MENHARIGFARVIGNKVTSPDDVARVSIFVILSCNTCKEPGEEGKLDRRENRESARTGRLMTITYNLILLYFKRRSKFIYLSNLSIFLPRLPTRPLSLYLNSVSQDSFEMNMRGKFGRKERAKKKRRDLDKKRKGRRPGGERGGGFWPSCTNTVAPLSPQLKLTR